MSRHIFVALYTVFFFLAGNAYGSGFDFSSWDGILKENVKSRTKDGVHLNVVDYAAIKKDPRFAKIISALAIYAPKFSNNKEKIAFWSNVYNILAIKTVIDNPGVKSIRDVGSFFKSVWKRDAGKVGNKVYTLDFIEHGILRKLGEPRIHAAIVCASVSCPDLRTEAYDAARLDKQLDDQWKDFLANRSKGLRADFGGQKIRVSKIFKWFEGDFQASGGIRAFMASYLDKSTAAFVQNGKNKVVYMDYNWNLNGKY